MYVADDQGASDEHGKRRLLLWQERHVDWKLCERPSDSSNRMDLVVVIMKLRINGPAPGISEFAFMC